MIYILKMVGIIIAIVVVVLILIIGVVLVIVFVVKRPQQAPIQQMPLPPVSTPDQTATGGPPFNQPQDPTPSMPPSGGSANSGVMTPPVQQNSEGFQIMDNRNSNHKYGWTRAEAQRIAQHFGGRMGTKAEVEQYNHVAGKNVMTPDFIGTHKGNGVWDPDNKSMRDWNNARASWYFVGRQLTDEDKMYAWDNSAPAGSR
jgi:hypothetical protein